jgi:hypothetical protein
MPPVGFEPTISVLKRAKTEEKTSPITTEYQNDTQQNIGNNNNVRYYETTDPLSIE